MRSQLAIARQRAQYTAAETAPVPLRGALITKTERQRMSDWLRARGETNTSSWRRRKDR